MFKKPFLTLALLFYFSTKFFAANENFPIGARSWGMGNTSVTLSDEWAAFNNIGTTADLTQISGAYFYENRFGLPELTTQASAFIFPHPLLGNFSLSYQRFGDKRYNDQKIGIGYARNVAGIRFGFVADFLQTNVNLSEQGEGMQTKNSTVFEFGISTVFIKKIIVGAQVYNFSQTKLAYYETLNLNEYIPTIIRSGVAYTPIDKLIISVEAEKDLDHPSNYKAGIEYKIISALALRTGISTQPEMGYYGIGIILKMFQLDYALNVHDKLGISHHASVSLRFGTLFQDKKTGGEHE
ncbi:MAG: hypothetical protein A3H98_13990 [Bacteroidetes bacterium RIFCSPLOWO2_02_FULL_36_8]|nr:MAG: hypothetical protein A3H98_13990 [Bacteroidetes bacterium RIFCSPLOWO2_02_FULL_36_8]OFY70256.1 MAG: hypothetical protein A3G23_08935 [Bacteroidetes bacterium RIFCSPLOWO2_12_FULL_37_12]